MMTQTMTRRARGTTRAADGVCGDVIVGAARGRGQGDLETGRLGDRETRGLGVLQEAVTAVLSSPSLLDGFGGARDSRHLDAYAGPITEPEVLRSGFVHVQCTRFTRDLLKRAGIKRPILMNSYQVAVIRDRFNRLQLAPVVEGGVES